MNSLSWDRLQRTNNFRVLLFFVLLIVLLFGEFLKAQKKQALAEESNQESPIEEVASVHANDPLCNNLSRVKLKDAMTELRIKDRRTFIKWCAINEVEIIPDVGGAYVFKDEFEYKAKIKAIEMMKNKYGSKWKETMASGIPINEKNQADKATKIDKHHSSDYQPQGEKEKMFYEKLMNSKNETKNNLIG